MIDERLSMIDGRSSMIGRSYMAIFSIVEEKEEVGAPLSVMTDRPQGQPSEIPQLCLCCWRKRKLDRLGAHNPSCFITTSNAFFDCIKHLKDVAR